MSLEADDLPREIGQDYLYEVSELWSLQKIRTEGYVPIYQWLTYTGVDAVAFEGYGLLRFRKSEDRTMFLLQWDDHVNR